MNENLLRTGWFWFFSSVEKAIFSANSITFPTTNLHNPTVLPVQRQWRVQVLCLCKEWFGLQELRGGNGGAVPESLDS